MLKDLDTAIIELIFENLPALTQRERMILAAAGVKIPARDPDFPTKAGYVIFSGSSFEFEQGPGKGPVGTRAIIMLQRPLGSWSNGLVAYDLASGRLASWRGEVDLLVGERSYWPPAPIPIWDSLLDFLRHDRAGVLIVDPERAPFSLLRWVEWGGEVRPLLVQSEKQAQDLRRKIKALLPPVLVQHDETEAA